MSLLGCFPEWKGRPTLYVCENLVLYLDQCFSPVVCHIRPPHTLLQVPQLLFSNSDLCR